MPSHCFSASNRSGAFSLQPSFQHGRHDPTSGPLPLSSLDHPPSSTPATLILHPPAEPHHVCFPVFPACFRTSPLCSAGTSLHPLCPPHLPCQPLLCNHFIWTSEPLASGSFPGKEPLGSHSHPDVAPPFLLPHCIQIACLLASPSISCGPKTTFSLTWVPSPSLNDCIKECLGTPVSQSGPFIRVPRALIPYVPVRQQVLVETGHQD